MTQQSPYNVPLLRRWIECPHRFSGSIIEQAQIQSILVQICDGNQCAATLLGGFYEDEKRMAEDIRQLELEEFLDPGDQWTEYLMKEIFGCTSHLFPREDIQNALSLLQAKQYIDIHFNLEVETFRTLLHISSVDDALNTLIGGDLFPKSPPLKIAPQVKPPPIQPERNHRKEAKKVDYHLARAKAVGLPATLTLQQWLDILDHFQWKCAFCVAGDYEVLEHLVPLIHGGGTSQDNCSPACCSCNSQKRDRHPLSLNGKIQKDVERVSHYLQSRIAGN